MSSGQKTTTTRQSDAPWKPSQPYLESTMKMAGDWLKSPAATSTYQGTRVIPFSQQSLAGMDQMGGIARNAMGTMQNPLQAYSGMFGEFSPMAKGDFSGDKYFSNTLNRFQSMLPQSQQFAQGNFSSDKPFTNTLQSNQRLAGYLDPIARGDFAKAGAFNSVLNNTLTDVQDRVALEMEGAGRAGGGLNQATLARSLGDVAADMKLDYQNAAQQNLLGYNSAINNDTLARMGYGAQNLMGFGNAINDSTLQRQGFANDMLLQYGNAMPGAYNTALMPGQTNMQIGSMYEDLAGKYAQEQYDKWNERRLAPIEAAATANPIFTGSGQLGGTSKGTVATPNNWGQQAVGFGTAALGAGK